MAINISPKTDYSPLLSSLNNRNAGGNLLNNISLSDYKNLKSGSYHKLLNSYYKEKSADQKASTKTDADKKTVSTDKKTNSTSKASDAKSSDSAITKDNWKEKLANTTASRKAATTYTASGAKTTSAVATSGMNVSDYI